MKILDLLKKHWKWAAVAVLAIILVTWRLVSANKNKVSYQTTAVTRGTIVSSISASGQILTTSLVNVSTQASGVVSAVYVKNGDYVYAGQRIASITLDSDGALANARAWQSLQSAQNAYRSTQASLANVYDQIQGHAADETFAQKETRTKAEVANDNAYVALAAASLAYRETSPIITAPASGTLDNITITPGMTLTNSSSSTTTSSNRVAVVRSKGNPIATFNVSEVDVNRVLPGQKTTITLDSISGKTFTGVVATVDKIGTVSSGVTNYPVVILFDTTAPEILPNMAATANIIINTKSGVLSVSSDAVQTQTDGSSYVQVLQNGKPVNITVETGLSNDTQTEITSGVNEGEEIITGSVTGSAPSTGSTSPFSTFRVGGAGGAAGGNVRVGR